MDYTTLAVVLFIINTLQVSALFAQWKLANKYRGGGWWTLGILATGLGFFAMLLRSIPGLTLIGIFANNLLFVSGQIMLYTGILLFFDRRVPKRALLAALAAYVTVDFFFVFVYDHLVWRGSVLYLAIAALAFLSASTLWKYRPRDLEVSSWLLIVAYSLHGLFFVVGFILVHVFPPANNSSTAQSPAQILGIFDGLVATTLWTFGFILLVNQRLNADERQARQEMELIFHASPDAVILSRLENGLVIEVNDGFTTLTGFSRSEAIGKLSVLELNFWKDPADRLVVVDEVRRNGFCKNLEFEFRRKDGSELTGIFSARQIMVRGAAHMLSVVHDVTERKLLERRLQKQASTDALTGAANRRYFIEAATFKLQQAQKLNLPLSVAIIDLDHFKQINDTCGHKEGDRVLVEFTRICEQNIRGDDMVARIGGDEFALLLPNSVTAQAGGVAERIRAALAASAITPRGVPNPVTISVGIAGALNEPETLDAMLARADLALYEVKQRGRNGVQIAPNGS